MHKYGCPIATPFTAEVAPEVWVACWSSLLYKLHKIRHLFSIVYQCGKTKDRSKSKTGYKCEREGLATLMREAKSSTSLVYVSFQERLYIDLSKEERLRDEEDEADKRSS